MQFTRIPFASSAFYRLGTVLLAALRETCNPQPCYMFPPHLLPQGTSLKPCLVAVSCLLYRFRHPCGVLCICFLLSHYLTNLIHFLFVLFCITKIQLIFDTPKFLSSFFIQKPNFFSARRILLKNECCILYNTRKPKKQTNILKDSTFTASEQTYILYSVPLTLQI